MSSEKNETTQLYPATIPHVGVEGAASVTTSTIILTSRHRLTYTPAEMRALIGIDSARNRPMSMAVIPGFTLQQSSAAESGMMNAVAASQDKGNGKTIS